jgi:hypothetical protein
MTLRRRSFVQSIGAAVLATSIPAAARGPGEATTGSGDAALRTLLDPDNRFQVRHPLGYQGPAFRADGMLVWGFTAGILAALFTVSGWEIPWNYGDVRDLDTALSEFGEGVEDSAVPR